VQLLTKLTGEQKARLAAQSTWRWGLSRRDSCGHDCPL